MARETSKKPAKKAETLRQRTERANEAPKKRQLRATASKLTTPLKAAKRMGGKEYYLPMPDNRVGRFLNKRRSIIPRFLREAWQELRQVEWPGRKTTLRLTFAVFVFSLVFGLIITLVDYGLDKLFKKIFL